MTLSSRTASPVVFRLDKFPEIEENKLILNFGFSFPKRANQVDLKAPLPNIEELARTDPLWQKVLDQEAATPQIKLFWLMSRITDARVFVADTIELYKLNQERLVVRKMRGVPELVSKPQFWKTAEGGPTAPSPEIRDFLIDGMERTTREKIEKHYPQWVLNQTLVTYCTILDSYLDSSLDAVLQHNPKILYGLSGAKNIELKRVIELGSVDAIVREIRAKEIRNFSNGDIADRLNYLKSKLSIDTDKLFDWNYSDEETDRRLEGLNLKSLEHFYQQRHDIVHRDKMPISRFEELDLVAHFFLSIGSKLALLLRETYHLWWDLLMLANRELRYNALKSQSDPRS
jgi:hypothetical protein